MRAAALLSLLSVGAYAWDPGQTDTLDTTTKVPVATKCQTGSHAENTSDAAQSYRCVADKPAKWKDPCGPGKHAIASHEFGQAYRCIVDIEKSNCPKGSHAAVTHDAAHPYRCAKDEVVSSDMKHLHQGFGTFDFSGSRSGGASDRSSAFQRK